MSTLSIREYGTTAKLYRFSRRVWAEFKGGWDYQHYNRSDLCTMIRYIFVLMPLVFAMNLLSIGFLGWAVLTLAYLAWLNLSVTGLFAAIVGGIICAGIAVLTALTYGSKAVVLLERSEAARVLAAAYRAKKEKICPLVEMNQ